MNNLIFLLKWKRGIEHSSVSSHTYEQRKKLKYYIQAYEVFSIFAKLHRVKFLLFVSILRLATVHLAVSNVPIGF